jgi:hypothetical protein
MHASSSSSYAATATASNTPHSVAQALYQTIVSVFHQCLFYAFGGNTVPGIDPNVYEAIYRAKQRQSRQRCCDPTDRIQQQQEDTLLISLAWALDQTNMEYIVDFLRKNNNDAANDTAVISNLEFRLCTLAPPASTNAAAALTVLSTFLQDETICKLQSLSLNYFPLGIQGASQLLLPLVSASCYTNINELHLCNIGLHGVEGGEFLASLLSSGSVSSSPQPQQEEHDHNQSNGSSNTRHLHILDCSNNPLGPEGAGALFALPLHANALRAQTTPIFLKELNLARCSIGDRGIQLVARALSSTTLNNNSDRKSILYGVVTFNLSENQLTWECLTDLSTILQQGNMTKLEHLVLSGNEGLLPHGDDSDDTRTWTASMETKRNQFWKALLQNTTLTRLSLDGCSDDIDTEDDNDDLEDDVDDCHDSFYTSIEHDILRRNVYLKRANVLLRHHDGNGTHSGGACYDPSLLLAQGFIQIAQDTTMTGATAVFRMIQQGDLILNRPTGRRQHDDASSTSHNDASFHCFGRNAVSPKPE